MTRTTAAIILAVLVGVSVLQAQFPPTPYTALELSRRVERLPFRGSLDALGTSVSEVPVALPAQGDNDPSVLGTGCAWDTAIADLSDLRHQATVTPAAINEVLASYGSPAMGTGQVWYDLGCAYGINPAMALAFFIQESSAGTNPAWAGWKPNGATTHNVGNIICAGYDACHGRFRDYPSWNDGIEDWYRLIAGEYIAERGTTTVAAIIPIYAPAVENDVDHYVNSVNALVTAWQNAASRGASAPADQPWGNPLGTAPSVVTQGYGVGTHAPAATWGAVDLAVDGNGDGGADPDASWGAPIYATHDGVVTVTPNSVPAGNHVWVSNSGYRTGYSHLASFTVDDGAVVTRGTQIGTMGSTGQSSGPHLDYQVWQTVGGVWVNVDPNGYGVREPLG